MEDNNNSEPVEKEEIKSQDLEEDQIPATETNQNEETDPNLIKKEEEVETETVTETKNEEPKEDLSITPEQVKAHADEIVQETEEINEKVETNIENKEETQKSEVEQVEQKEDNKSEENKEEEIAETKAEVSEPQEPQLGITEDANRKAVVQEVKRLSELFATEHDRKIKIYFATETAPQDKLGDKENWELLLKPSTFPSESLAIKEMFNISFPSSETETELLDISNAVNEEQLAKSAIKLMIDYDLASDKEYAIQVSYHSESPFRKQLEKLVVTTPLELEIETLREVKISPKDFAKLTKQKKGLENSLRDSVKKETIAVAGTLTGDLIVENYVQLEELDLSEHELTSLTIINCPELRKINARNNQITQLDINRTKLNEENEPINNK
ncbi:8678_t:CDS:2, partial [Funneliformis geosporum]